MKTLSKQQGYLLVDHRASPGLPAHIARAAGYDPALAGEGKMFEADTMTCKHCKVAVIKNLDRIRERGHCSYCHHYICDWCAFNMTQPDYVHMPFDKLVEVGATHMAQTGQPLGSPPKLILPSIIREPAATA